MLFQVWNCSYLEFPENTTCMSVVIMSGGDVFNSSLIGLQILLHVLEEPWLVVVANFVYLQDRDLLANPNPGNNNNLIDNTKLH